MKALDADMERLVREARKRLRVNPIRPRDPVLTSLDRADAEMEMAEAKSPDRWPA